MSEARPIQSRELLLDDESRSELQKVVDPLIEHVLNDRGYIETKNPIKRVHLDNTSSIPSTTYLDRFKRNKFYGMSVSTTEYVSPTERLIAGSTIELNTVGGFAVAQIVGLGDNYKSRLIEKNTGEQDPPFVPLSPAEASEILEDIRSFTELGYSSSDTLVPSPILVSELAELHTAQNVDRSASYQFFTDTAHADIQVNIGESFELHDVKVGTKIQHRRLNPKKVFELMAIQPLGEGELATGVRYVSGKKQSEIKLTAEIKDTDYSDEEKQALYNRYLEDFQEKDVARFGRSVITNLLLINNPDSNIIRLG